LCSDWPAHPLCPRIGVLAAYRLSQVEGKVGSPEKPLSDLGARSYASYWQHTLLQLMSTAAKAVPIRELAKQTAIKADDINATLAPLRMIRHHKGVYSVTLLSKEGKAKLDALNAAIAKSAERANSAAAAADADGEGSGGGEGGGGRSTWATFDPDCLQWKPPTAR
jgi:hypothetical protein